MHCLDVVPQHVAVHRLEVALIAHQVLDLFVHHLEVVNAQVRVMT